jgi:hypothetical protein
LGLFGRVFGFLLFTWATFGQQAPPASHPPLSADEIIAHNLQTRGGADRLRAINTIRITRHVVNHWANGQAAEYDEIMEMKRPSQLRFEQRLPDGPYSLTTFDGTHGWRTVAGDPRVTEITGAQLKPFLRPVSDRIEGEYADYAKKGYKVELRGLQKSQGRDCYGLLTTFADGDHLYRCFDTETFNDLEIRNDTTTTVRADFRPVEGVFFSFRGEYSSAEGTQSWTVAKIELNPKLDDSEFRKPRELKALPQAAVLKNMTLSADQVRAARRQIMEAIQQVRTCPARFGVPACSFESKPGNFTITQKKIQFWAPVNKEWGGPRWAYINLDTVPGLEPKVREGWRVLDPAAIYMSFDPDAKNYDKSSTNVLFDRPRLEWATNSPEIKKFVDALEVLKKNAKSPVGAEEQEMSEFHTRAMQWRALAEKPALPDAVHREEVLAKNSIQVDQNPEVALAHFEKGLSIEPLWPAGQLGAATICGELQRYECAVMHAERFLDMVPDAPQAETLRDKLIIWKDKLGKE